MTSGLINGDGDTSAMLHPLIGQRWSPTTFDLTHEMPPTQVELLLEAARWAPSAGNSQPWAFVAARRGERDHDRIVRHLAPSSARWAPSASLLVVNLAHVLVADTDFEYSEFALYDLGQAVAYMTVQARALDLQARQFRAFDQAGLAGEFAVPPHWQVTSITAVGQVSAPRPSRTRRPIADLVWRDL